jgi:hypothetical protein
LVDHVVKERMKAGVIAHIRFCGLLPQVSVNGYAIRGLRMHICALLSSFFFFGLCTPIFKLARICVSTINDGNGGIGERRRVGMLTWELYRYCADVHNCTLMFLCVHSCTYMSIQVGRQYTSAEAFIYQVANIAATYE